MERPTTMPKRKPLISATGITAFAAIAAILLSGGHSPFTLQPAVAGGDAVEAPAPIEEALVEEAAGDQSEEPAPAGDPATTQAPKLVAVRATPQPTRKPSAGSSGPATPAPTRTPRPTSAPTQAPTPAPTPQPTARPTTAPTPTPATASAGLSITLSDGQPVLSWGACSSASFSAYGVVRSLDAEIHYPPEDNDTVVALIKSSSITQVTDTSAPSRKVYYRVWCLSNSGGEYKSISTTPTVSVTVP